MAYLQPHLRRCECENSQFRDIDSPSHSKISTYVQSEGIPNNSHFFIIETSLNFVDSKKSKRRYFVWDLFAISSSILELAFDALEATLLFMLK
jgi:hypothetical protein